MPSRQRTFSRAGQGRLIAGWLLLLSAGCTQNWWNAFLDPSQTGNYRSNEIVEIQKTISFNDKPMGLPGATDPLPEDQVAYVEEYRIGPGDDLSIRLLDFVQVNAETDLTPLRVDELGYINVPQLGLVHVEGRSAHEVQQDLIQRAKTEGIYNQDDTPTVTVSVLTAQQRTFNVSGTVAAPGMYPIVRPDFRLREAINLAGGLDTTVKFVYVFRDQPRQKRVRERPLAPPPAPAGMDPGAEPLPAPPVSPVSLAEVGGQGDVRPANVPAAPPPPATRLAVPPDEAERELTEALAPGETTTAPATRSAAPPARTTPATTRKSAPTWIYINDQFIEAPADPQNVPPQQPGPDTPAPTTRRSTTESASQPVDWEELAQEGQQRIIRIPADKLRNGESSYDVVIRHQDWVRLDPGPVGVFYLNGHVIRPGTYNFVGEEITLKQAVAAAGGLDPLAWPSRCSITRRLDESREEILQLDLARILEGKDPDFYLKPNDLIDVGTHAIAPLLATIRNSFRLTYGFGFVYDRNFADIDAYIPKQNPEDRRRLEFQQRFNGLLP